MSRGTTALLLALLAVAAGMAWWLRRPEVAPELNTPPPSHTSGPAAHAAGSPGAPPPASIATDERQSAQPATQPPGDAVPTITLRVVDAATGDAIPGATVHWFDDSQPQLAELAEAERPTFATDRERYGARFGEHATSDRDGAVRVALCCARVRVVAHAGSRHGELLIGTGGLPARAGLSLALRPEHIVEVQVRAGDGRPLAGMPIEVECLDGNGKTCARLYHDRPFTRTEGDRGMARLRNLVEWLGERPRRDVASVRVAIGLPGIDARSEPFPVSTPPTEPIVLVMPDHGSVLLRAEVLGRVFAGRLLLEDTGPRITTRSAPIGADGWARFDFVPIGRDYHAKTPDDQPGLRASFAGPVHAGQEVRVVLAPDDSQVLLTGRALGEGMRPLADCELDYRLFDDRWPIRGHTRTDGQGRFVALGPEKTSESGYFGAVRLACRTNDGARHVARVAVDAAHSGRLELGDVLLQPAPLVVQGRIVTDGKTLRALRLEVLADFDPQSNEAMPDTDIDIARDADGRFECTGDLGTGRGVVVVEGAARTRLAMVPFAVGARDVQIAIDAVHALSTMLRLPAGAAQHVAVTLQKAQPGDEASRRAVLRGEDATAAAFAWANVPPGRYDLVVTLDGFGTELCRIPDVVVPAMEPDPRLTAIDLMARVRLLTVRPTLDGIPLRDGFAMLLRPDAAGTTWRGETLGEHGVVAVPADERNFVFVWRGLPPHHVHADGEAIEAAMRTWEDVTVTLSQMPELPPGMRVVVVVATETSGIRFATRHHEGDLVGMLGIDKQQVEVVAGRATLRIGEQALTVRLLLDGPSQDAWVDEATPRTVTPGTAEVAVEVPREAWERAIAKATSPR